MGALVIRYPIPNEYINIVGLYTIFFSSIDMVF